MRSRCSLWWRTHWGSLASGCGSVCLDRRDGAAGPLPTAAFRGGRRVTRRAPSLFVGTLQCLSWRGTTLHLQRRRPIASFRASLSRPGDLAADVRVDCPRGGYYSPPDANRPSGNPTPFHFSFTFWWNCPFIYCREAIHFPPPTATLALLTERLTSVSAVLACCLLGAMQPRKWHLAGFAAIAVVFFSFLYQDTATVNRMEQQVVRLVSELPPNQRVMATILPPAGVARVDPAHRGPRVHRPLFQLRQLRAGRRGYFVSARCRAIPTC